MQVKTCVLNRDPCPEHCLSYLHNSMFDRPRLTASRSVTVAGVPTLSGLSCCAPGARKTRRQPLHLPKAPRPSLAGPPVLSGRNGEDGTLEALADSPSFPAAHLHGFLRGSPGEASHGEQ